jgi:putative ABC transport system substrate-binding protein
MCYLSVEAREPLAVKRREFIALVGSAAAWPFAARAQQPKMLRVGFVGMQARESPLYANFLKRMAELGYQEGRNFTFDYIQTPNVEGYERNYRELATRKVDLFLAVGNERALRAALLAAEGKPIAFLALDFDPLARGYVASLSRPGGNVTGIFVRQVELAAKRIEIAREAFPRATVVGIAFDRVSPEQRDAAAEAARKFGLEPRMIEVKGEQGYGRAFSAMDDARGQPIILPAGPTFLRDRVAIAQALLERRIPSIAAFRENMEAGALISYGFDLKGLFYDIASYVHQIARGAKPSDMPIEQSPRFYMAVNLKAAASLDVSLSDVFVARANEVRE